MRKFAPLASIVASGGSEAVSNLTHPDHLDAMGSDELGDKSGFEDGVLLCADMRVIRLNRLEIARLVEMQAKGR